MHNQTTISKRGMVALAAMALVGPVAFVAAGQAEPPSGVTATPIVRGTFAPFNVRSHPDAPFDFKAKSKDSMDFFVRQHDYQPNSHTGWHVHPGPVFITVTKGTLYYYEYNDKNCTRHEVKTGETFVDDGSGHIVREEKGEPAQDISIIAAPDQNRPFRTNLPNPAPNCPF